MVEAVLHNIGLLTDFLLPLAICHSCSLLEETLLFLNPGLGSVLVEEPKDLSGRVLVGDLLELGKSRRHLEAHLENLLLALKAHILGPLHHAREVAAGLNVLANTEVAGPLLNERVLKRSDTPC